MPERDLLRRVSASLARDHSIDWDAVERSARTNEERQAIQQLRMVAAVAGFHRAAQSEDAQGDSLASISLAKSIAGLEPYPGTANELVPSSAVTGLVTGSRWGHLEILERVGRGAFGAVYRARE